MNSTISYYDKNAPSFREGTQKLDFSSTQDVFLERVPCGGRILDFGCGAGRDTKYFLDKGMEVDAIDGSDEMCSMASEYSGITVNKMLFEELDAIDRYDGIWACASILHLNKDELTLVFNKMITALKQDGIIYSSFKYGKYEGYRNERFFTDFDEETMTEFISRFPNIQIYKMWVTNDIRPGRSDEKWLNILLRLIEK